MGGGISSAPQNYMIRGVKNHIGLITNKKLKYISNKRQGGDTGVRSGRSGSVFVSRANNIRICGDINFFNSDKVWQLVYCECRDSRLRIFSKLSSATPILESKLCPTSVVKYGDTLEYDGVIKRGFCVCIDDMTEEKNCVWVAFSGEKAQEHWVSTFASIISKQVQSVFEGTAMEGHITGSTSLRIWLGNYGLPLEEWGKGAAKTVNHLYKELLEGDCDITVEGDRLVRILSVANVYCTRSGGDNKILMETHQEFPDGRLRTRPSLMSEKMHRGEEVLAGALRGLHEELGHLLPDDPDCVRLDPHFSSRIEETLSPSFPGLLSRYMLWDVHATVEGAFPESFTSDELKSDGSLKMRHHWKWIPPNLEKSVRALYDRGRSEASGRVGAAPPPRSRTPSPSLPMVAALTDSAAPIVAAEGRAGRDHGELVEASGEGHTESAGPSQDVTESGETDLPTLPTAPPLLSTITAATPTTDIPTTDEPSLPDAPSLPVEKEEQSGAANFIEMAGMRMFSPSDLEALMGRHGINTSVWGRNQAKSVQQLWDELVSGATTLELVETEVADEDGVAAAASAAGKDNGEGATEHDTMVEASELDDEPPPSKRKVFTLTRILSVVCVKVLQPRGHLQLLETHQQFADGRVRPRNKLLSSKMIRGETLKQTAVRGLLDELGSVVHSERAIRLYLEDEEQEQVVGEGKASSTIGGTHSGSASGPRATVIGGTFLLAKPRLFLKHPKKTGPGLGRTMSTNTLLGPKSGEDKDNHKHNPNMYPPFSPSKSPGHGIHGVHIEMATLKSPSFPGLPSRYMLYTMCAAVKGLPEGDFHTIQYKPDGEVKQKHYWKWRTDAQVQAMLDQVKFKETQSKKKKFKRLRTRRSTQKDEGRKDAVFRDLGLMGSSPVEEDELVDLLSQQRYTEEEIEDEILNGIEHIDGLISPEHFEVIRSRIEKLFLVGRADDGDESGVVPTFNETETEIIKRMFPMCLRIEAQRLTGGFSGSRVLQMQSVDMQGRLEQPCIVKLGKASEVRVEARRMADARPYLGENAPKLMQAEYSGGDDGIGSLRVQLAGACWCLPDLMRVKSPPLNTFEHLYLHELRSVRMPEEDLEVGMVKPVEEGDEDGVSDYMESDASHAFGDVAQVLQDLFESVLYSATVEHPEAGPRKVNLYDHYDIRHHLKKGVLCRNKHPDTGERLPADKIRLPVDVDELDLHDSHPAHTSSSSDLLGNQVSIVEQVTGVRESPSRFFARFQDMMDAKQPGDDESHRFGLVHGDLNGRNILIDSANFVWVIDFDHTCMDHALKDVSKLEWCILFQYTELLDESELGSALGLTTTLARNVEKYMPSAAALGLLQAEHAHLEMAWNTLSRLRALTPSYGREPGVTMTTSQLLPSLNFALRSLLYPDVSLLQKKWVMGYAVAITHVLMQASLTFSPSKQLLWEEQGAEHNEVVEAMDAKLYMIEQRKYFSSMLVRHTFIVDPISRENINVMEQRVTVRLGGIIEEKIEIPEDLATQSHEAVAGVGGEFVSGMSAIMPDATEAGTKILLVGPASSGKSVLLRKALVMMCQNTSGTKQDFVPILISMIEFGRITAKKRLGVKDNMVQAYLANKFGRHTARFRFLCQAIAENRAVLLLDGLEESGLQKAVLQEYIIKNFYVRNSGVRAIISARPSGAHRSAFLGFQFMEMMPLSASLQQQVVAQRVAKNPNVNAANIMKQIQRPELAAMASNPLLLSLLISTLVSRMEARAEAASKNLTRGKTSTAIAGTPRSRSRRSRVGSDSTIGAEVGSVSQGGSKSFTFLAPSHYDSHVAPAALAVDAAPPKVYCNSRGMKALRKPLLAVKSMNALRHDWPRAAGPSNTLTRTALYKYGVELMLHRSAAMKYTFLKGGNAAASDGIEEDLQCLRKPEAMVLLEALALRTHRLRRRDFTSADMAVCMEEMGVSSDPTFFTIANTLLSSTLSGMVPIIVCSEEDYTSTTLDLTMRFAHLSFQEYLASRRLGNRLEAAIAKGGPAFEQEVSSLLSSAHEPTAPNSRPTLQRVTSRSRRISMTRQNSGVDLASSRALPGVGGRSIVPLAVDLCFDPWYKQVVLMAGGGLPMAPLASLQELILSNDNASGAGVSLCVAMLNECATETLDESSRATLLENAFDELKDRRKAMAPLQEWLMHPATPVQRVAVVEIQEGMSTLSPDRLVVEVMSTLRTSLKPLPWYARLAAVTSLAQLPYEKNATAAEEVLPSPRLSHRGSLGGKSTARSPSPSLKRQLPVVTPDALPEPEKEQLKLPPGLVAGLVERWRYDEFPWVQRQAVNSLRCLGLESNRTVLDAIEAMLASADPRLRCKAVCAVGELQIMDRGVIQLLLRELCTSQDFSGVTRCLRKLLTPPASATDSLSNTGAGVGTESIPVAHLSAMGGGEADTTLRPSKPVTLRALDLQAVLCKCIKNHPDPSARAACLRVFHDTPAASSESVAAAMCAWLSDDDPLQRASCVMALEEWCTVDRNVWYGVRPVEPSQGVDRDVRSGVQDLMSLVEREPHMLDLVCQRRTWCKPLENTALYTPPPTRSQAKVKSRWKKAKRAAELPPSSIDEAPRVLSLVALPPSVFNMVRGKASSSGGSSRTQSLRGRLDKGDHAVGTSCSDQNAGVRRLARQLVHELETAEANARRDDKDSLWKVGIRKVMAYQRLTGGQAKLEAGLAEAALKTARADLDVSVQQLEAAITEGLVAEDSVTLEHSTRGGGGKSKGIAKIIEHRVAVLESLHACALDAPELNSLLRLALNDIMSLQSRRCGGGVKSDGSTSSIHQQLTATGSFVARQAKSQQQQEEEEEEEEEEEAAKAPPPQVPVDRPLRVKLLLAAGELTRSSRCRSGALGLAVLTELRGCWAAAHGDTSEEAASVSSGLLRLEIVGLLHILDKLAVATKSVVAAMVELLTLTPAADLAADGSKVDPSSASGTVTVASSPSSSPTKVMEVDISMQDLHYGLLRVLENLSVNQDSDLVGLLDALGDAKLAPFVCWPITNYFRTKRKEKATWGPSRQAAKALEGAMKKRPESVEAATVMKELLIGKHEGEVRGSKHDFKDFFAFCEVSPENVPLRAVKLVVRELDSSGATVGTRHATVQARRDASAIELTRLIADKLRLPHRRYTVELRSLPRKTALPRFQVNALGSSPTTIKRVLGAGKGARDLHPAVGVCTWDLSQLGDEAEVTLRPFLRDSRSHVLREVQKKLPSIQPTYTGKDMEKHAAEEIRTGGLVALVRGQAQGRPGTPDDQQVLKISPWRSKAKHEDVGQQGSEDSDPINAQSSSSSKDGEDMAAPSSTAHARNVDDVDEHTIGTAPPAMDRGRAHTSMGMATLPASTTELPTVKPLSLRLGSLHNIDLTRASHGAPFPPKSVQSLPPLRLTPGVPHKTADLVQPFSSSPEVVVAETELGGNGDDDGSSDDGSSGRGKKESSRTVGTNPGPACGTPPSGIDPKATPSEGMVEGMTRTKSGGTGVGNEVKEYVVHAYLRENGARAKSEEVKQLLATSPWEVDDKGYLPLHVAVESDCSVEVVQVLLGIHPDAARALTIEGRLPFHLASGRPAVALELMLAYPEGSELPDPLLSPTVPQAVNDIISSHIGAQINGDRLQGDERQETLPHNTAGTARTSRRSLFGTHLFSRSAGSSSSVGTSRRSSGFVRRQVLRTIRRKKGGSGAADDDSSSRHANVISRMHRASLESKRR